MNEEEQFTLFRSLCNIRPAGGMPLEWMNIENEYLNILADLTKQIEILLHGRINIFSTKRCPRGR